jgi:hypothetical protein
MRSWMTRAGLSALGGLLLAACGPAPYAVGPDEPTVVEGPPGTVYVLVGQGQPAPAPAPTRERPDRWIPDGLPRPNPFAEARTWVGAYDCPQGRTDLTLRVVDVRGKLVRAVFDFHHAPTDASGQYLVVGAYDEGSSTVDFEPGPWIIHPDGYDSVGLRGRVSLDGGRFAGAITDARCGRFQLRVAR